VNKGEAKGRWWLKRLIPALSGGYSPEYASRRSNGFLERFQSLGGCLANFFTLIFFDHLSKQVRVVRFVDRIDPGLWIAAHDFGYKKIREFHLALPIVRVGGYYGRYQT
jgi:hypothetical protein